MLRPMPPADCEMLRLGSVEVAPALAIHRLVDLALKAAPDLEPGLLYVERQFGVLVQREDGNTVGLEQDAQLRAFLDVARGEHESRSVRLHQCRRLS